MRQYSFDPFYEALDQGMDQTFFLIGFVLLVAIVAAVVLSFHTIQLQLRRKQELNPWGDQPVTADLWDNLDGSLHLGEVIRWD